MFIKQHLITSLLTWKTSPEKAEAETYQSVSCDLYGWIKPVNTFSRFLCGYRFDQLRLLLTWHTKSGQLLGKAEFPQIIKLQLKAWAKEENKPFKLYSLPNPLKALYIYPGLAKASWAPTIWLPHILIYNPFTGATLWQPPLQRSGVKVRRACWCLLTIACCCQFLLENYV